MKKRLSLLLIVPLLFVLVACGGDDNNNGTAVGSTISFRALRDNETGAVVSLGDPQSVFDDAFGESVQSEESNAVFYYLDGLLRIVFLRDGEIGATWIRAYTDASRPGRFEIMDVYMGMTANDLTQLEQFSAFQLSLANAVVRSIDDDGTIHSSMGIQADNRYSAMVHVENDVVVRLDIQIPMNRR